MNSINRYQLVAVLVGILFITSLKAGAQNTTHKKRVEQALSLDPQVRTGKLKNGFTYFIRHNAEPKHRVLMYLVNKTGSILEDEDQRGLAHFMEHMSFNGTTHFPHKELVNYLQKAGVRFGADINAYTSFDETVYQLPLPSDKPDILREGLLIMHDWSQSAILDPGDIEKERGVILEEERLGKGAGERMQRQYFPIILNRSRYASRVPIGLDTVLNNFKRPTIARFYHDWYRPDLQALIIVGDINADSLESIVKARFSDLKNPLNEKHRPNYSVPLTAKNQFIAVTDHEMTGIEAEVLIKHKGKVLRTKDDFHQKIVVDLFNQMLGSRIAELSRQSNPPFVSGSAGINSFIGGTSIFDANVSAKQGELETGFKAIWREIERVRRFGFTQTELNRAKTGFLNDVESSLAEKNKIPSISYIKEYQEYFLRGVAAPGIEVESRIIKNALPGITPTDLKDLASEYITNYGRDILVLAPDKDKSILPNENTVNRWMTSVSMEKLQAYKDDVSGQSLLKSEPVPGKIISEQTDAELNITTLILNNGLRIVVKPTDFKNNEVQFSGFASGGSSLVGDADFQSASNAAGIIMAGGAGNFNLTQLNKYLDDKQCSVSTFISDRFEGVSGTTTPKDMQTTLQLIFAYFTEPRKDTAAFKGIIERSRAAIADRYNNPENVFNDTVSAVLGNYNYRRKGPTIERINLIDLDKAYKIYKERFSDASGFTFTFVGNIDIRAIKPLLEKYLGGLPSTNTHTEAKDLNIHIPEGKIEKIIHKGSEPKATVILVYSGALKFNLENKVNLDALKETLEIRLLQRLRGEESGVYSPTVYATTSKFPQSRFNFVIQFGCSPKNVDKLIASTVDEVNKLKLVGPLPENLDKWRAEAKNTWEPDLKTNDFWLQYLNTQQQNNEDYHQFNEYEKVLDAVTINSTETLAQYCLSGNNFIKLILLPDNKSE